MKLIRSCAFWGAILGAYLCGHPAYPQQPEQSADPTEQPSTQMQLSHYDPEAPPLDGLDVRGYVSDRLDPDEQEEERYGERDEPTVHVSTEECIAGVFKRCLS